MTIVWLCTCTIRVASQSHVPLGATEYVTAWALSAVFRSEDVKHMVPPGLKWGHTHITHTHMCTHT